MELLQQDINAPHISVPTPPATVPQDAERAARRTLRAQIAKLEGELADAFLTAWPMGGLELPTATRSEPRLLDLGELERVREQVFRAKAAVQQAGHRRLLTGDPGDIGIQPDLAKERAVGVRDRLRAQRDGVGAAVAA